MSVKLWNAETVVNVYTAGNQNQPSVAVRANGDYLVAFVTDQSGSGDINYRIYAADGTPKQSNETGGISAAPSSAPSIVASGANWRVSSNEGSSISSTLYDGEGYNSSTITAATDPVAASFGSTPTEVLVYEAAGEIKVTTLGSVALTSQVNTTTGGTQVQPDAMRLTGGGFVVDWATSGADFRYRVYNSAGTELAMSDLPLNSIPFTGSGEAPHLAALANGGFVATWGSGNGAYPGSSYAVYARVFNAGGVAVGPDILVSSAPGSQDYPDIVSLNNNGFLVVWEDTNTAQIKAQAFDNVGGRAGGEVAVSSAAFDSIGLEQVSAATLADGRVVVTWTAVNPSASGLNQDIHQIILDPRDGVVNGTNNGDTLYGSASDDQITGQAGNDTVYAGAGNDYVSGGIGADTLLGQAGDDVILGGVGQDYMAGGSGSDTFVFVNYTDSLAATPDGIGDFMHGSDVIDLRGAAGGLVALVHDGGGDTMVSFAPASGGGAPQGSVFVIGDVEGPDLLTDAGTNFYIVGSALAETLVGGAGADFIQGGGGADYLAGGAGADVFKYTGFADSTAAAPDVIGDFQHGSDKIDFTGGAAGTAVNLVHGTGVTYVYFAPGGSSAKGLIVAYGDVEAADVKVDSGVTVVTSGLGGGDVLTTSGNADLLVGGKGPDTFRVGQVTDSTPASPDVVQGFQSGVDKIDLSAVSGSAVNIIRDGAWSYIVYDPHGATADGLLVVQGAVTVADLGAEAGATIFVSHASIDAPNHAPGGLEHTHVYLY